MEKTNFKKWGWWAIGGVVGIAIIAVLVSAMGSGPEPTNGDSENNDGQTEDVANNVDPDTEASAGGETEKLPESGPVEVSALGLLLAGVAAYLVSLAIGSAYRRVIKVEKNA